MRIFSSLSLNISDYIYFFLKNKILLFPRITSSGLLVCACVHRDISQASFVLRNSQSQLARARTNRVII
uniref:Uncharacterized protein n=1 Tax=Trichogramma kaykai TaxID=54128 RepID=A0ABD2VVC2_9HYME